MFVLGITGGIGSGKSTVAGICSAEGIPLLDADQISHQVTAAGGIALPEIVEEFGEELINVDGSLNRSKMANLVFQDKRALDRLSAMIHRHVLDYIGTEIDRLTREKYPVVVLDVPVPVKTGFLDRCDQVWSVWADDDVRLARLERRGLARQEALRRMAMQMTREEYADIADYEIENNSDFETLEDTVRERLFAELALRGIRLTKG